MSGNPSRSVCPALSAATIHCKPIRRALKRGGLSATRPVQRMRGDWRAYWRGGAGQIVRRSSGSPMLIGGSKGR